MPEKKMFGAIYPDDMWVDADVERMHAEFRHFVPASVEMGTVSTSVPDRDADLEAGIWLAANGEIEEAAARMMRFEPSCFAYFCTTASFVRGVGGDQDIIDRIKSKTGLPATTTSTAMVRALKALNVKRISLASPYMPDVEDKFRKFLGAHGFGIVSSVALNLTKDHSIVPPERIRAAAEGADHPDAEAIFVGCTGQKLGALLDDMESKLGKPVLSANQVTVWAALQLLGVDPVKPGCGTLMRTTHLLDN